MPIQEYNGYINASFVNVSYWNNGKSIIYTSCTQGYRENKAFIIAQSPMEHTARDFWKMIVDYKVPAIVMLCGLEEGRKV